MAASAMDPLKFVAPVRMTAELSDWLQSIGVAVRVFTDQTGENCKWTRAISEQILRSSKTISARCALPGESAAPRFNNPWTGGPTGNDPPVRTVQLSGLKAGRLQQLAQAVGSRGDAALSRHALPPEILSAVSTTSQQMSAIGRRTMTMIASPTHQAAIQRTEAENKTWLRSSSYLAERLAEIRVRALSREKLNAPQQLGSSDAPTTTFEVATSWQQSAANQHDRSAISCSLPALPGDGMLLASSRMGWEGGAPRVMRTFEHLKSVSGTSRRAANRRRDFAIAMVTRWFARLPPPPTTWFNIGSGASFVPMGAESRHLGVRTSGLGRPFNWMKAAICETSMPRTGILAAIDAASKELDSLFDPISSYFHFHSPPAYALPGDKFLTLRLGEMPYERIKPAAEVSAVHLTAPAVTVGEPRASGAAASITVNYAPVINGAGLNEHQLLRVLERHAYELHRIISRQQERRDRLAFK